MTDNIPVYLVVVRYKDFGERNDNLYRVCAYTAADAVVQVQLSGGTLNVGENLSYVRHVEPWTEDHEKRFGGSLCKAVTRDGKTVLGGVQLVAP